jgi:hypothetical protein
MSLSSLLSRSVYDMEATKYISSFNVSYLGQENANACDKHKLMAE